MDRKLYLKEVNDYCGSNFILNEEDAINWFDSILEGLEEKTTTNYPDSIFYCIDGVVYMELQLKKRYLYCSYKHIWSILEKEFAMQDSDVQKFIKDRVEMGLKLDPITPQRYTYDNSGGNRS